ncbi:Muskelin N-terminus-domain-containing protein [Gorgonomyces haynaldii]|nr:Muskelin N-terminus-domain-containing protein [Gorgonomyces haynaldii]
MLVDKQDLKSAYGNQVISYDIHSASSHSANYHPRHIKVNKPQDQSSRWSSGSNNHMQYITLKLDQMAVIETITFGKYHKVHVCNLREFKVFGGMSLTNMTEILHSGLRNDSEPETFALVHKSNGVYFPCQYIKIVPLIAWGANFNFSIWFVELRGIQQKEVVQKAFQEYCGYRESEVVRMCLKYFRQRNYLDLFERLQQKTQLQLESPLLTELHQLLVLDGNFAAAEKLLDDACSKDLFADYISDCAYKPIWKKMMFSPETPTPTMRGGHQMCIDTEDGIIYLFGGWDGKQDLCDFWQYSISKNEWKCISEDTRREGGPGPRSCHKVCFDHKYKQIYTLGKYVDPESRPNVQLDSDFWKYDIPQNKWVKITSNTALEDGPMLIYDHQMLVDSDRQVLYVFGGRAISPEPSQVMYSGLYAWDIQKDQWRLIRDDLTQPEHSIQLKSRIGHSMLMNPVTRELYIFAGQRNKDYLSDFYIYEVDNDVVYEVARDYSKSGGPDAGFTQRATMDLELGELYVLSGLMREKNATSETVKNSFWSYSIKKNQWTKIYQNENVGAEYWSKMADVEPRPRFAHQLVYDSTKRVQYLFGGNPGEAGNANLRLDDLWQLHLVRPTKEDVLRLAKFNIRKQQFMELCVNAPSMQALEYLRTQMSPLVQHTNEQESKLFRELTTFLFNWKKDQQAPTGNDLEDRHIYRPCTGLQCLARLLSTDDARAKEQSGRSCAYAPMNFRNFFSRSGSSSSHTLRP